ncbi:MAG: nuclease-related domain-containing protein [Actinocrinis sp.]
MAVIGRAARPDGPPRAGQSLQSAYAQRHRAWIGARRRSAALSALWWGPAVVILAIIAGVSTHYPFFGLIYFVLLTWAVLDVLFRRPDSLIQMQARAGAESATGKVLRSVEIRGRATVLHDRVLTRTATPFEVEHLVLSPRGAFLIDTKEWHGRGVRMFGPVMYLDHVDQGPMFEGLVERARLLGEALTAAAAHDEEVGVVTVLPIVAVHTDELPGTPRNMRGVTIVVPEQLPALVRSPDLRWSPAAVQSLVSAADSLLMSKESTGVA